MTNVQKLWNDWVNLQRRIKDYNEHPRTRPAALACKLRREYISWDCCDVHKGFKAEEKALRTRAEDIRPRGIGMVLSERWWGSIGINSYHWIYKMPYKDD